MKLSNLSFNVLRMSSANIYWQAFKESLANLDVLKLKLSAHILYSCDKDVEKTPLSSV